MSSWLNFNQPHWDLSSRINKYQLTRLRSDSVSLIISYSVFYKEPPIHNNNGWHLKNERSSPISPVGTILSPWNTWRLLWSNSNFCNLKLPADAATNVEIIGRKRPPILLIMKHAITHNMLTWEKGITWLPISHVFPSEAFTQMNILGLHSHGKLQVLQVQISLGARPPAQTSIIGLHCMCSVCVLFTFTLSETLQYSGWGNALLNKGSLCMLWQV